MKVLTILLLLVAYGEGAKILALLGVVSRSHHIFNKALTHALAERGHQITVLSPDKDEDAPNVTYLQIEGLYKTKDGFNYEQFVKQSTLALAFSTFDWVGGVCEKELESIAVQNLMKSTENYDLIITEATFSECLFGFIPKFGSPPVVAISGFGIPSWLSETVGTPNTPSYIPNSFLPYTEHMSFFERMYNTIVTTIMSFLYTKIHLPKMEALASKYFKTNQTSFLDIARNFSILLANVDFGKDGARPLSPNVIPIAGMHLKEKANPLPKEIQQFLDGAKDGFIFFSLGSNLRSSDLPEEKLQALLDAFAELPQRILWKFESDKIQVLPSNVKIGKWLPQSDILGHPKIRAFISHCGKMSTTESLYRGVPIIGVPFLADQWLNLQQMMAKGVAVKLDFMTLTKESVLSSVLEILNNESYQFNMKKMSEIFKDHPETALDRAIFWTEYVIRHGGAPHLRPASTDIYWYQYLLLDVLVLFSAAVVFIFTVIYFTLKKIVKFVKRRITKKLKNS